MFTKKIYRTFLLFFVQKCCAMFGVFDIFVFCKASGDFGTAVRSTKSIFALKKKDAKM